MARSYNSEAIGNYVENVTRVLAHPGETAEQLRVLLNLWVPFGLNDGLFMAKFGRYTDRQIAP
jgi:hypothetical protein